VLYSIRQPSMASPCLRHRDEPVLVQAFVAELAVEDSMYAFSFGLPGRMNDNCTLVLVCPGIEHLAFELRAMIHRNRSRQPACVRQAARAPP
jgi:hypothetical protein